LQFEKSLVSQAITRVYEAVEEGKVDRLECERLLLKYKNQLLLYDEKIDALQPLVDFTEVSEMRNDVLSLLERKVRAMDQKMAELGRKYGMSYADISKKQERPTMENKNLDLNDKFRVRTLGLDEVLVSEKFKINQERESKSEEKSVEKLQKEIVEALSRLDQIEINDRMPNFQNTDTSATLNDKSCLRQFR
jgi:septum formation topological specificity factor MinE